jgi:glutamine amidotransferase
VNQQRDRQSVVVVRTGIANLASVLTGLERAGAAPIVSDDADELRRAEAVVLPGVGSFGAAMAHLQSRGLCEPLVERASAGKPLLAICLGLQLLCRESEESRGVKGLDVLPRTVRKFPAGVSIPQLGWNKVRSDDRSTLVESGHAYFANSYRLESAGSIDGWQMATAEHAGPFVAAMWKDSVLACQFHPELSGEYGARLLRRWLGAAGIGRDAAC